MGRRISALKDDPGYALHQQLSAMGNKAVVYLNGTEQPRGSVFTADENEGFVLRAMRGCGNKLVIDRKTGYLKMQRLTGLVKIVVERPASN